MTHAILAGDRWFLWHREDGEAWVSISDTEPAAHIPRITLPRTHHYNRYGFRGLVSDFDFQAERGECRVCGAPARARNGRVASYCSPRCGLIVRWLVDWYYAAETVAEQEFRCGLCAEPLTDPVEWDHIIPSSAGGGGFLENNIQATHSACNRAKRARQGLTNREIVFLVNQAARARGVKSSI